MHDSLHTPIKDVRIFTSHSRDLEVLEKLSAGPYNN
jgi:hypothetical protein